jgi:hypothetical protein
MPFPVITSPSRVWPGESWGNWTPAFANPFVLPADSAAGRRNRHGLLPLHTIKFIDDEGRVECLDGATYQVEPADLAAIMPKTAKKSKLAE